MSRVSACSSPCSRTSFRACSRRPIADSYSPRCEYARARASTSAGCSAIRSPSRSRASSRRSMPSATRFECRSIWPRPASARARTAGRGAALERLRVQVLGDLELIEPERDVGLEQLVGLGRPARAGGQVVLLHADAARQLAQDLERRNAIAALDPADVHGGASLERELALAQPGGEPGLLQSSADGGRIVHVRPAPLGHQTTPSIEAAALMWTPVNRSDAAWAMLQLGHLRSATVER